MAVSTIAYDMPDIVIVPNVSLGTIQISGGSFEKTNIDVSGSIPSGYALASAVFNASGSYGVYCYECRKGSDATVVFRGFRISGSTSSITPSATLICERN